MKMQTVLGALPANQIIRFPSGRYGFVGRVDARLAYVTADGGVPTDAQMAAARHCGPGIAGLKTRSYATEEEARAALDYLASLPS